MTDIVLRPKRRKQRKKPPNVKKLNGSGRRNWLAYVSRNAVNVHEVEVVEAVVGSIAALHNTRDLHQDVGVTMTVTELLREPTRMFHRVRDATAARHPTVVRQVARGHRHHVETEATVHHRGLHRRNAHAATLAANGRRRMITVNVTRLAKMVKIVADFALALLLTDVAHCRLDAIAARRHRAPSEAARHHQSATAWHHHRQIGSADQTLRA